jgi:serine/threonine-protein kinase
VSRDGRWIAYQSNESGRSEVWVRPFPGVDGRGKQVSLNGGSRPVWARSTNELFFVGGSTGGPFGRPLPLLTVEVGPEATLADAWTARPLFSSAPYPLRVHRNFDASKDDRRFLVVKQLPRDEQTRQPRIVFVQHWLDELKRQLP